jgi:hypothetical protein
MTAEDQESPTPRQVVSLIPGTNAGDSSDIGSRWWQRENRFWFKFSEKLGNDFDCQSRLYGFEKR